LNSVEVPTIATLDSFYLDTFEVTVGRFNAFLADYDAWRSQGNPVSGVNTLPHVPDSGWQDAWNDALPPNASAFRAILATCPYSSVGLGSSLPINCLSWEEAFAFCAWDGARLPTSAEWEYATVGGNEYRLEPWGEEPLTHNRAVYDCLGDDVDGCATTDVLPVGSKPLGRSRWGQYDLVGSVCEYMFDYAGAYPETCTDCALAQGEHRTFRGGAWYAEAGYLEVGRRDYYDPWMRDPGEGLRCARSFE